MDKYYFYGANAHKRGLFGLQFSGKEDTSAEDAIWKVQCGTFDHRTMIIRLT
jgi:hypothetical protein